MVVMDVNEMNLAKPLFVSFLKEVPVMIVGKTEGFPKMVYG